METPTSQYLIDDAAVLNKTTRKSLNNTLTSLEVQTSFKLLPLTPHICMDPMQAHQHLWSKHH